MDNMLVKYLAANDQISLNGLGYFSKKKIPAKIQSENELIFSPVEIIEFLQKETETDTDFIHFLTQQYDASTSEMHIKLKDYIAAVHNDLNHVGEKEITGLGTLKRKKDTICFYRNYISAQSPLRATATIPEYSRHMLKVGDKEMYSDLMQDYFESRDRESLNWMYWLMGALGAVLLLLILIRYA